MRVPWTTFFSVTTPSAGERSTSVFVVCPVRSIRAISSAVVLHPLNLRLPGDQLAYIVNHADDQVVFVDTSLLPAVEKLAPHLKCVKHYVIMDDKVPADCTLESVYAYD